jgi:hypothetical protein
MHMSYFSDLCLLDKLKVKLYLYFTEHHATKYWDCVGIAPRILDLGTRWSWVVSFTPRPLHFEGKSHWYPLGRRLGGPQSLPGRGGEVCLLDVNYYNNHRHMSSMDTAWNKVNVWSLKRDMGFQT